MVKRLTQAIEATESLLHEFKSIKKQMESDDWEKNCNLVDEYIKQKFSAVNTIKLEICRVAPKIWNRYYERKYGKS